MFSFLCFYTNLKTENKINIENILSKIQKIRQSLKGTNNYYSFSKTVLSNNKEKLFFHSIPATFSSLKENKIP